MDTETLAKKLHEALCRSEHTEHCDWYYPNSYARRKYLEKAETALALCKRTKITPEVFVTILKGTKQIDLM